MGRILVGTASWTDKGLIASKRFYPQKINSAEDRLRYYATQFPMVEVDSSYYALPSPENSRLWVARTPPAFVFNIKAFRLFTGHQTERKVLPPDVGDAMAGHFAQKKYLYYRDLPLNCAMSCGSGTAMPSSHCMRRESCARCISSSHPG